MTETTGGAWWKGRDLSADGSRRHGTIPGRDQSVTNIFEYSNILVTNIYSDITSGCFFCFKEVT